MAENDSGTLAAVDHSPPLTSLVGEMFGDYRDVEPESDAGAPPSATPDAAPTGDVPEGPPASEPAGEPPAAADLTASPDNQTPEQSADADPMDGARPLDYTVEGQARNFDGITLLKSGGGIIDPDAVAKVQRVFGERDHLYEQSRVSHQKYQDLERLTAWQTQRRDGFNHDGTPKFVTHTLTGREAVEASRSTVARVLASYAVLEQAITDPAVFAALVDFQPDPSNAEQVLVSPKAAALELLRAKMENASMKAEAQSRSYVAGLAAQPSPAAPSGTVASIAERAMPSVEAIATHLKVTSLSGEDKQFLAAQLPRYVRATTPAERQQGFGAEIIDASFGALVQREATKAASAGKVAETATAAANANAKRLAAASVGRGGKGGQSASRLTPTKEPERTRADDFDDAWDRQQAAAAGALRAHATAR